MRNPITVLCLLVAGILPGLCLAQAEREPAGQLETLPEEFVITGSRARWQLRDQVQDAQERMHALFNEINGDERFDISCSTDANVGSHIAKRRCLPQFQRQATAAQGRAYLAEYRTQLGQIGELPGGSANADAGVPAEILIAKQQQEMKERIRQLALENAEYREAIIQYVEMKKRYTRTLGWDEGWDERWDEEE